LTFGLAGKIGIHLGEKDLPGPADIQPEDHRIGQEHTDFFDAVAAPDEIDRQENRLVIGARCVRRDISLRKGLRHIRHHDQEGCTPDRRWRRKRGQAATIGTAPP